MSLNLIGKNIDVESLDGIEDLKLPEGFSEWIKPRWKTAVKVFAAYSLKNSQVTAESILAVMACSWVGAKKDEN